MKKLNCLLLAGMFFVLPLFMGAFDKDKPAASTSLRASNPELLANQSQLQTAVNNEHIFSGTSASTQTGDHTQGSARCYSQASAPATAISGSGFLSTDLGSLWVDTDDNAVYVLTATTPTWTPVSTEVIATLLASNRIFAGTLGVTGDFDVNTDKCTISATTGNALFAGTLDIASTVPITAMLDEDDMASDSATAVISQQSVKAYVDGLLVSSPSVAKASGKFSSSGGLVTGSYNITSVSKDSTGVYTVTWDTDFADINYVPHATPLTADRIAVVTDIAAGTCKVRTSQISGAVFVSSDSICSITAFGNQ